MFPLPPTPSPLPLDNLVPKETPVREFWAAFCQACGMPESTPYQSWYFGATANGARVLAEMVLRGPKRATAGMSWYFDEHPEAGPIHDGYSVVTELDGTPRLVIRTVSIDRRKFIEVDSQFAWDEGEGDRTLRDWREGHRAYFSREMASVGKTFDDNVEITLERFELLYPFAAALNPVQCGARIVPGYLPGGIGALAALQAQYYGLVHGFGAGFEGKVASGLAAFMQRFDPLRDGLWLVAEAGAIHGGVAVEGGDGRTARLRWFILSDAYRGRGFGKRLLDTALAWCRRRGFARVSLTSFEGLDVARALYERAGFRLMHSAHGETWGRRLREQTFEIDLTR